MSSIFCELPGGSQRDAGLDSSLRSPNQVAIIPGVTHHMIVASSAVFHGTEFLPG
jgi:hypothetical protein